MGLDAFVRCRCFEEGKLVNCPVPYEDLYLSEDGYVSSRTLDEAHAELGYGEYRARFGPLDDEFFEWKMHPCEHENMEYCSEHVGNIMGWATLQCIFEDAEEGTLSTLKTMLPTSNDGFFPASKAQQALDELEILRVHVRKSGDQAEIEWVDWKADILECLLRASLETGNPIQWC